jgi:hypothetical protein
VEREHDVGEEISVDLFKLFSRHDKSKVFGTFPAGATAAIFVVVVVERKLHLRRRFLAQRNLDTLCLGSGRRVV